MTVDRLWLIRHGESEGNRERVFTPNAEVPLTETGIAQARAGKLRAQAVMNPVKLAGAESIAPLSDALSGFDAVPRLYLLAPAGTPATIVERLSEATRTVMASADIPQAAAAQGAVPAFVPAGQLADDIVAESSVWGKVIREQKITAD